MRIIVTGSRDWDDTQAVAAVLGEVDYWYGPDVTLVHGAQGGLRRRRGVLVPVGLDYLAAREAERYGWAVEPHPADWYGPCRPACPPGHRRRSARGDYCPSAGPYRNWEMAEAGADLCLAWPGGRGTRGMEAAARRHGIPVVRVRPGEPLRLPRTDRPGPRRLRLRQTSPKLGDLGVVSVREHVGRDQLNQARVRRGASAEAGVGALGSVGEPGAHGAERGPDSGIDTHVAFGGYDVITHTSNYGET